MTNVEVKTDGAEITPPPTTENKQSVEDLAAEQFQTLVPLLKRGIASDSISKKELQRIFMAVVEYPLQEKKFLLRSQKSVELIEMAIHLLNCKSVMTARVAEEMKEKQKETENESSKMG